MVHLNFIGGSLHNHIKQVELTQRFEQKKQEQTLNKSIEEMTERQQLIQDLERQAEDIRKNSKIASIDSKLKAGGAPTAQELNYLKENNYQLYTKAVEVIEERRAYRKSLEAAKTKDDVSRINGLKLNQFTTELSAAKGDFEKTEQISRRFMGVMSEHTTFVASKRYEDLPTDEEYYNGKRKPEYAKSESENLPNLLINEINRQLNEKSEIHIIELTV